LRTPAAEAETLSNTKLEELEMSTTIAKAAVLGTLAVLLSSGVAHADTAVLRERAKALLGTPAPAAESPANPVTDAKVNLGRMLYFDQRLSIDNDVSCNSCHQLDKHGVDNEKTSKGHKAQRGDRNSPTVYNAAFHFAQFWDGRAADVEEQAKGPILNPVEMAMPSEPEVINRLEAIEGYREAFAAAFPGEKRPITYDNLARAIGAFERKLVTPSPFDEFLAGKDQALAKEQQEGLTIFLDTGCTVCHSGTVLGGQMYQKLGLVKPYPTDDPGRAKITGNDAERGFFKVPSLRNVEKTAPYFHDGSIATLDQAARIMAEHQLGRTLSDADVTKVVAFLESLTGKIDSEYTREPKLP
jgi:cytochrome c peroxidase